MKITGVLITKEKEYPQEVLDSLLGKFDEVLIETECPSILRRYELALKARNDIIYVQDDDCIVDVDLLKEKYNGQLTNFISEGHQRFYQPSGMTLIGWGALFPKSMIDFSRYLDKFGASPLFLREADRVFTYLNQPFNSLVTEINHLPSASIPGRMYTTNEHWETLKLIQQQCAQLQ
jgi:hypothetical protein